jgi:2-polyprenyl-6-methoxyphenol hydroxylase-like FAD-dependent oxidoreductase
VFDCDVLIAGGGPVGLYLAAALGQRGVAVRLFDDKPGTCTHPAANANSARTMEHFRRLGVSAELRAAGLPPDYPAHISYFTAISGYELARLEQPCSRDAVALAKTGAITWPTPEPLHRCSQLLVEPILLKAARACPSCAIDFSAAVVAVEQDEESVVATVAMEPLGTRAGGTRRVRARYLVGCDGPRSLVRKTLDIGYTGIGGEKREFMGGRMAAAYFHAPALYEVSPHRPSWQYWTFSPSQRALITAIDGRGHFVVNVQLRGDEAFDPEMFHRQLAVAVGVELPYEMKSTSIWTAGYSLVAEKMSEGRVFLAGDSAHLFTPTGGLGYNTGIEDAANLAWKLEALLKGSAGPGLSASYELERRPAALRNTSFAREFADSIGHVKATEAAMRPGPEGDAARRALSEYLGFHAAREFSIPGVQLGVRYEGSPLVSSEGGSSTTDAANFYIPTARPGHRAPHYWLADGGSLYDRFGAGFTLLALGGADDAEATARLLAVRHGVDLRAVTVREAELRDGYQADFALVRPDLHVAWRGNRLDDAIDIALARALGHGGAGR